jgi:hypothetical protein
MGHFRRYCSERGYSVPSSSALDPLEAAGTAGEAAQPGRLFDVAAWFKHACPELAGVTVSQYISTIRHACAVQHHWQFKLSAATDAYLYRYQQQPRHKRIRQPATVGLLRAVCDDPSIDIGVKAAVLVAYSALLRVGEYTSPSAKAVPNQATLRVGDVRFDRRTGSVAVRIPHSKTDRYNAGETVHIMPASASRYCPVRTLRQFLDAHPCRGDPSAPLFVKAGEGSAACVTPVDITRALRAHARAVGLDPELVCPHSLRIGGAFEMADAGVEWESIAVRGRWSLKAMTGMREMYARMSQGRTSTMARALDLAKPKAQWARPLGVVSDGVRAKPAGGRR